jgi:outer membrane receptor protein involved in Fe transport
MVYGFFSRGYKPGGFNPPIGAEFQDDTAFAFDEEEVDAYEVGFKSTLADGQLTLNGSAFWYDYQGLQVTRIKNNSSINENIDSEIMGVELEWVWQPEVLSGLAVDGSFSWLDTELQDVESVDVLDKGAGDPNWVNLKNIDPGALTGTNYVAWAPSITPDVINAAYAVNGALSDVNGTAVPGTVYTGGQYDGIPAYFSRNFLNAAGVATSSGEPTNLDGNSLPNSPEYSFRLGVQYTWNIDAIAGMLTARWDYYWQDESYGREFNTKGDEIDAWDQHNASLIYESFNGNWQVRAWVRNIQDEDNVTGHYLTSDTSGYFRNWFLTEPRVYGATVRYSFGN